MRLDVGIDLDRELRGAPRAHPGAGTDGGRRVGGRAGSRTRSSASSAIFRYVVSFPPGDAQHPAGADGEDRLAPRVRRRAVAERQHAEPGERGAHAAAVEQRRRQGGRGLVEDLRDVGLLDRDVRRVALEVRVGRAEQQEAVPGHRERHAHVVLRHGERRRPVLAARDEHVRALAQPDGRPGPRILEPPHVVDPRPRGVDDHPRAHRDRLAVDADLGACHPPAVERQRDDLRPVEDRGAVLQRPRRRSRGRAARRSSTRRRRARRSEGRRDGARGRARPARSGCTSQLRRESASVE